MAQSKKTKKEKGWGCRHGQQPNPTPIPTAPLKIVRLLRSISRKSINIKKAMKYGFLLGSVAGAAGYYYVSKKS